MKKLLYVTGILYCSAAAQAQNANLVVSSPDARIVVGGSAEIVLDNANLVNNGSTNALEPGLGTVRFTGMAGDAFIGGTAESKYYNLRINKSGVEVDLQQPITVSNQLELINGNVDLNDITLTLGNTGVIQGETYPNGNRIYCAGNQNGKINATRTLGAGANTNIAGLGLDLTVSGATPGITSISRGNHRQASTAFLGAGTSIARYYDITPTVNTGFTYTFLFRYHDQELAGMPESSFVFYRSSSYGANMADWQEWGAGIDLFSPGYPTVGFASHNPSANTVSLSGINSFSRWTVSNAVVSPLPIELLSFTADCENGNAVLNWKTASEINNQKFIIHRSADMQVWDEILVIPGAGNSNQELTYTAIDARALDGLAYYRLSQQDYNGTTETFEPVSIFCGKSAARGRMSVYPNPASDIFTVDIYSPFSIQEAQINLVDVNGKVVLQKNSSLAEGENKFIFDRSSLAPGTYFIRLKSSLTDIKPLKLITQ